MSKLRMLQKSKTGEAPVEIIVSMNEQKRDRPDKD